MSRYYYHFSPFSLASSPCAIMAGMHSFGSVLAIKHWYLSHPKWYIHRHLLSERFVLCLGDAQLLDTAHLTSAHLSIQYYTAKPIIIIIGTCFSGSVSANQLANQKCVLFLAIERLLFQAQKIAILRIHEMEMISLHGGNGPPRRHRPAAAVACYQLAAHASAAVCFKYCCS